MATLIIQENGAARTRPAVNGEEITITAPCDCTAVTGVQIAGVWYPFYDACGNNVSNIAGKFSEGSLIRVLIDTTNTRAQIINQASAPITNETKALFGLGADAVPDDVFRRLRENAYYKVGDTLTTFRTDLDETWSLCNGELFDPTEYPDLANVTPAVPAMFSSSESITFGSDVSYVTILSICEGAGYQVALVTYRSSSSSSNLYLGVVYSKDWFVTKTFRTVTTMSGNPTGVIRYADGEFAIVCAYSGYALYSCAVSNIETDTFSFQQSFNGHNVYYVYDMWREDGSWYVAVSGNSTWNSSQSYHYYPFILSTKSLASPQWSSVQTTTSQVMPTAFKRAAGYYVFWGYNSNSSQSYITYSRSVNGPFTVVPLTKVVDISLRHYVLEYDADKKIWFRMGYAGANMVVFWTSDITTDSWTTVAGLESYTVASTLPQYLLKMPDGRYIGLTPNFGATVTLVSDLTDPTTWEAVTTSDVQNAMEYNTSNYPTFEYDNPSQVRPFILNGNTIMWPLHGKNVYYTANPTHILSTPIYALPVYDNAPLYSYIKVKEDEA